MIRPAQHTDIPLLLDMVMRFFEECDSAGTGLTADRDTLEFFIQDTIEMEDRIALVAEHDGQIVGAMAGMVNRWEFNYDIICLRQLGWFVPVEMRKYYPHIPGMLYRAFVKWGQSMGATVSFMASTYRDEADALNAMYRKHGMKHSDSYFVGRI